MNVAKPRIAGIDGCPTGWIAAMALTNNLANVHVGVFANVPDERRSCFTALADLEENLIVLVTKAQSAKTEFQVPESTFLAREES